MIVSSFELQVLVSDRPIREYGHQGRTFVEGKSGSPFTLKFRNNTAVRVLAVPSLDGLSAIDGQPATGDSRGYIVPAYSATEIKGWRKDLAKSAAFVFTDRAKSYAAQTAGGQNLGVIAVKVFAELLNSPLLQPIILRPYGIYSGPLRQTSAYPCGEIVFGSQVTACSTAGQSADYACDASNLTLASTASAAPAFNLGTGWGAERSDQVSESFFPRGLELATLEIFYDDAAGLTGYGVQLTKELTVSTPAFPVSFGGFCQPPKITV